MAGDGLDQKQPVAPPVVDDDIRHLAVFVDCDPELGCEIPVEERPLGARVAHVHRLATGDEAGAEVVDDLADQFVLSPRREPDLDAILKTSGIFLISLNRAYLTLSSGRRSRGTGRTARGVKAMLRSKGFDSDRLEEAMTMATVETEFRRGWDAVRQKGIEAGQLTLLRHRATRKFGRETAEELARLLGRTPDGEQISRVAAAIVDCDAADDFLARVPGNG